MSSRKLIFACFLVLFVLWSWSAEATQIWWTAPTTYTDNTAIPPLKIGQITYVCYVGPSSNGPWTVGPSTGDLTMTFPDPEKGETLWYTVESVLDGQTSAKAVPVSKTVPFVPTVPPGNLTIQ